MTHPPRSPAAPGAPPLRQRRSRAGRAPTLGAARPAARPLDETSALDRAHALTPPHTHIHGRLLVRFASTHARHMGEIQSQRPPTAGRTEEQSSRPPSTSTVSPTNDSALLLTRRARNALGTATHYTRRNDSPRERLGRVAATSAAAAALRARLASTALRRHHVNAAYAAIPPALLRGAAVAEAAAVGRPGRRRCGRPWRAVSALIIS
jgi:hypothetical protein